MELSLQNVHQILLNTPHNEDGHRYISKRMKLYNHDQKVDKYTLGSLAMAYCVQCPHCIQIILKLMVPGSKAIAMAKTQIDIFTFMERTSIQQECYELICKAKE
jgi:hypothetical protein